jgi:hypothetical protein
VTVGIENEMNNPEKIVSREDAKTRRGIEFQNLLFAASRAKILTGMDWGTETEPNQRSLHTARMLAVR